MTKAYRHPYDRKQRPNNITRPPLPVWLQKSLAQHIAEGKRRESYTYWKRMYYATPAWLTDEHVRVMKAIHKSAGPGQHVDHEVPINNPIVCGLNVPWNLRVIGDKENLLKGNAYWPDMPLQPQDLFDEHRYEDFRLSMQSGGI